MSSVPKKLSPVDRSGYDSNRVIPCKVQLEPQLAFLHFLAGETAS